MLQSLERERELHCVHCVPLWVLVMITLWQLYQLSHLNTPCHTLSCPLWLAVRKDFISCDWFLASIRCSSGMSLHSFWCNVLRCTFWLPDPNSKRLTGNLSLVTRSCSVGIVWRWVDIFVMVYKSGKSTITSRPNLSALCLLTNRPAPHIFQGKLYLMLGGQVYSFNCNCAA